MPVGIIHVDEQSPGQAAGLRRGDRIVRVNGQDVTDALDFHFFSAGDPLTFEIERDGKGGGRKTVRLSREFDGQPLGITVEELVVRHCRCNCIFCFVHQNPTGLRDTLYVKDEDYRYSFLYGNYVTGTNLSEWDIERIVRMRLSPLYFSVHSTSEALRLKLLGIKRARPIMPLLRRLTEHGIEVHTQIVLCPGLNDGDELMRTAYDLIELFPMMGSIAVVPLGLTKWRQGLPELTPFTPEYAGRFIDWVQPLQAEVEARCARPVLLLSDEIYLMAGHPCPDYADMEESPQLDNGVGMVANWYRDFDSVAADLPVSVPVPWRVAAFTTRLSAGVIERACAALGRVQGLRITPIALNNSLFGETIHVTGLLPGRDFRKGIQDNPDFDLYLIPGNALRRWDHLFLDDMSLQDVRAGTSKPVRVVSGGFGEFAEVILTSAGVPFCLDEPAL
ncbi:MAG: TIGR03279 family radical SAM protein [Candidatus Sumerlaeia bacterium]